MISVRGGRTDITNILLEGEHIDLDIQENVSAHVCLLLIMAHFGLMIWHLVHKISHCLAWSLTVC